MSRAAGTAGEALAADYLRAHGYGLLAHSYHCRFGEIDLIARKGEILCFVEVKMRTDPHMALPREYVTPAKQAKLRKTALFYLAETGYEGVCRFDVAEVYREGDSAGARVEYLEDAFQ